MSILCLLDPGQPDGTLATATALARRLGVPAEVITATDEAANRRERPGAPELIVLPPKHAHPRAPVPLLVARDPRPFEAWASGSRPLRVLIGWADDTASEAALATVVTWRRAGPVDVVLAYVYYPDEAAARYGVHAASMVEPTPALEQLIVRDIAHRVGELPGTGEVAIVPKLGLGRLADHLMELADAREVDVIAAGHHHHGGLRRLSSVAERVVGDARQSVLLAPITPEAPLAEHPQVRVVVAATDGSPLGNHAVPYAYALAPEGGEVHLVNVIGRHASVDDAARTAELLALGRGHERAHTSAHVVRDDDPARAIAHVAERLGADVVCIASHGRTAVARVLFGSVTDRLLHLCRRPVLVLHPSE